LNADIQHARRWECLAGLARDEEAELAWSQALVLVASNERAPRQHSGLHTDYPTLEVWRAFAELRLATAHMWAARGMHPSVELRKKKRRLGAQARSAEAWRVRATERATAALTTMRRLIEREPASRIGLVVTEFSEELARATHQGRLENLGFVMHAEYTSYRRFGAPYHCSGGRLENVGLFRARSPQYFEFETATTRITPALGVVFGVEFRFLGEAPGRLLPGAVVVSRPDGSGSTRRDEYPVTIHLGLKETFVWTFESDEEMITGPWTFEISLFDADAPPPSDHPFHGKLHPKARIASLEQAFTVASES
jgi:hypothetical protein